jgi:hypothetical protein
MMSPRTLFVTWMSWWTNSGMALNARPIWPRTAGALRYLPNICTDHFSELVPATAKNFEEVHNNFGRAQSHGSTRCPATVARGSIEIVVKAAISDYLSPPPDR